MKTKHRVVLAAVAAALSVNFATVAQETRPERPERGARPERPDRPDRSERGERSERARPGAEGRDQNAAMIERRLQRLGEELKLTAIQKEKLTPILKEELEKQRALRDNTELTPEQRRAKMVEIRTAAAAKVKPILTPEQWTKWEQLQQPARRRGQQGERPGTEGRQQRPPRDGGR